MKPVPFNLTLSHPNYQRWGYDQDMRNGQQTLSCDPLQRCIICSDLYYLFSITEECMKEGYYWIQRIGVARVTYYTSDTVDDLETGKIITDAWHLTRGDDICHS